MSLATLPRPLPSTVVASAGVAFRQLGMARGLPAARRSYWSFRCGKPGRHWNYQYWAATSPARSRHWRSEAVSDTGKATGRKQESGPSEQSAKEQSNDESVTASKTYSGDPKSNGSSQGPAKSAVRGEEEVQSEEQRFVMDEWTAWEKATRAHATARLDFLKQALEKDPYGMLFGGREARGAWNPWRHTDGLWRWPSLWNGWGRHHRGVSEYLESRSQELAKVFEEAKKELNATNISGDNSVKEENGVRTAIKKDVQIEEKGAQKMETTTESSRSTTIPSTQSGDVYIDLITLRKVHRVLPEHTTAKASASTVSKTSKPVSQTHRDQSSAGPTPAAARSIPRKSTDHGDLSIKQNPPFDGQYHKKVAGFASQEWPKREGFASKDLRDSKASSPGDKPPSSLDSTQAPNVIHVTAGATLPVPRNQELQLESVINRRDGKKLETDPSQPNVKTDSRESSIEHHQKVFTPHLRDQVAYNPTETKQDDVDLLTASGIRAAAGRAKDKVPQLTAIDRAERRSKLTRDFVESRHRFENALRLEIIDALKHQKSPTKSPLWSLWMLYDQAGRKDWESWVRRKHFTIKGEKELEEMQYLAKAYLEQMPPPSEIFASGGTSLSRYIDANRVSLSLKGVQEALNRWHMEVQSILVPRGVKPFSDDALEGLRRALAKYHLELRRQILSGKGPEVVRMKKPIQEKQRAAADDLLAKEVANHRTAMEQHENRPRTYTHSSNDKAEFKQWMPPGSHQRAEDVAKAMGQTNRDAALSKALREIYEADYGKITPKHRQEKDIKPTEAKRVASSEATIVPNEPSIPPAVENEMKSRCENEVKPGTENTSVLIEASRSGTKEAYTVKASEDAPRPQAFKDKEANTVLLTLSHRNGSVTLHPPSIWPVLQAQLPAEISPLESPALASFLGMASDPQHVLREVVNLQAKGFRLVSGRKKCLVFQQPAFKAPIKAPEQPKANEGKPQAVSAPASEANKTSSMNDTMARSGFSRFGPIPSVTSTGSVIWSSQASSTALPPSPQAVAPTNPTRASPDPAQPIRRVDEHFKGQSGASTAGCGSGSPPASPPPPSGAGDGPAPHSFVIGPAYRQYRARMRTERRRSRRSMRRFFRTVSRVLASAILVAGGAYSIGIVLEWIAKRRALRVMAEADNSEGEGNWNGAGTADAVLPFAPRESTMSQRASDEVQIPEAIRRWWGRVWWLGEGDMVGRTEWEESQRKWEEERARASERARSGRTAPTRMEPFRSWEEYEQWLRSWETEEQTEARSKRIHEVMQTHLNLARRRAQDPEYDRKWRELQRLRRFGGPLDRRRQEQLQEELREMERRWED